jgi:hypothetical protein
MMLTMNNSKSSVGFKRPPIHTRFRPGRSGNPSGRPKHRPCFRAALLSELATTMPGKEKSAGSKLEALVKTLVESAIAGDGRAQALLVSALERIGDVEEDDPNSLVPDDKKILDDYVGGELKRRANETDAPRSAGEHDED